MKKLTLIAATSFFLFMSCQSNKTKEQDQSISMAKEAIIIHDEIMPQIAHFDRATIKIDSILNTSIDEKSKEDLTTLKSNLEDATDNMMTWMKDYVGDSTNVKYQEAELIKIKAMKKQFENVSLESNTKLSQYK